MGSQQAVSIGFRVDRSREIRRTNKASQSKSRQGKKRQRRQATGYSWTWVLHQWASFHYLMVRVGGRSDRGRSLMCCVVRWRRVAEWPRDARAQKGAVDTLEVVCCRRRCQTQM